jgi:hypothetical protein
MSKNMLTLIRKLLNAFFLLAILLLSAPTLLFLTKSYYTTLVAKKTYIGMLEIPPFIEKSEEIIAAAKNLFASSDVRAIIITCDGNGGLPGPCQAVYNDILRLKYIYKKPIISYIEKSSLAGSYLIATAADYIVASEGAMIGKLDNYYIGENQHIPTELLHKEYQSLFQKQLQSSRPKFTFKDAIQNMVTGSSLITLNLIDVFGGNMEVEKILKTKTVIEGSIEKVHGSFIEHCLFYISDLIHRTVNHFRIK